MTIRKGIILAAGKGTRLHPATLAFGKPLLPLFDKPMIYYPLALMIEAGMTEVLIIVSERDLPIFEALLGDGAQWGIKLSFAVQKVARGIADAFLIGDSFAGQDPVCLLLGDNFFYLPGSGALAQGIAEAGTRVDGATIFCAHVEDPRAFGVATLDAAGRVTGLVEKPSAPDSNWAVTGLYLYSPGAAAAAGQLSPSARGELEVTDLNIGYMRQDKLQAVTFAPETVWFDLGTHESLLAAAQYIHEQETARGIKIGCPDTAAYKTKRIDADQLRRNAGAIKNPAYAAYLLALAG